MAATGPLLEAKLRVPARRSAVVARPRLVDRLAAGGEAQLTLVSAPAGFGKTTLVVDWLADERRPTAWISLDARDDDPAVFWTYVLAAVDRALPGAGADALGLLDTGPVEPALTALVNDLDGRSEGLVLVLDDFHVVGATEVHEGVAFLVEHLPPRVQLVITSRADPALPLARLRARGELVEVRAADLRFSADEAATYLNDAMGLALAGEDVEALDARTEGWIAALQLAALSMQGRDDVTGFIADFAGDDRFVVDYLAGEVLDRQSEEVRRFLLETSVLNRLSGPLCDAVTGGEGGQATLQALDRANLFLVPLDDRRHWYRYHHLFADVLRARLLDEHPDLVPVLHRRAADWFEHEGDRAEAIRHAMAGGHVERAADLVELAAPGLGQSRQDATLRSLLDALPDEVFTKRPVLTVTAVGALMRRGETRGVEPLLDRAEQLLDDPSAVVVDEQEHAHLPGRIAMYRTALAHLAGDLAGVIDHAHRMLEVVDPEDHLGRGAPQAFLALANWGLGELATAEGWEREAIATFEQSGFVSDLLGCSLALADIQVGLGRLRAAQRTLEAGLARAAGAGDPGMRGTADMHVALADLCRERDDLAGARDHLDVARDLGEQAGLGQNPYRSRVAMALLLAAEGDLTGAVDLLDEAEPLYTTDFSPPVRPVDAVRARVWVRQGDPGAALRWAGQRGLSADDELSYVREYEHVTLARALLASGAIDEAGALLDRLLTAAEEGGRNGSVIELLALLGRTAEARVLGEPEGYARVFLDDATSPVVRSPQPLVDPLSDRELDVLRLLRTDLTGPEIATELYVSLNTVRTHTKRIYTKLEVSGRRAAVRRADELGL